MSQWECNAARLASALFSLSESGAVWPTSERPVCLWRGHRRRPGRFDTGSDFRARAGFVRTCFSQPDVSFCLSQLVLFLVDELKVKVTICRG